MKIAVKKANNPRFSDLDPGNVFKYINDNQYYLKLEDSSIDRYNCINLINGSRMHADADLPVKKINGVFVEE